MECCDPAGVSDAASACSPCGEPVSYSGPLVDAHCHVNLSPLFDRHEIVIKDAIVENINTLVVNAVSPGDDWDNVQTLAQKFPEVIIPSYGLHPHYIKNYFTHEVSVPWEKLLEQKLVMNSLAGVGECGLDKMIKKDTPLDFQVNIFQRHLDIAKRYERVNVIIQFSMYSFTNLFIQHVSIHCVQAWGTLYDVLLGCRSHEHNAAIILHSCNSIPLDFVHQFKNNFNNVYFSLNGRSVHSSKEISVVNAIPLDRMLMETDSPSQIPLELKGLIEYNEPKLLNFSFNTIAKLRVAAGVDAFPSSISSDTGKYNFIRRTIYENSLRVFRNLSRV